MRYNLFTHTANTSLATDRDILDIERCQCLNFRERLTSHNEHTGTERERDETNWFKSTTRH